MIVVRGIHKSQVIKLVPELKSLNVNLSIESDYMYVVTNTYAYTTYTPLIRYLSLPFISNNNYGDAQSQLILRPSTKQYTFITTIPSLLRRLESYLMTESVPLIELKRPQIVNTIRKDTKSRYTRRKTIDFSDVKYNLFDVHEFLVRGNLKLTVQVRSYTITFELDNVLNHLRKSLKKKGKINYRLVYRYLSQVMDTNDLRIDCTCPDFQYRFAYVATKKGFKSLKPESRSASKTNPNSTGAGCKHIAYLLSNKKWIRKYVSAINTLLKVNPDLLIK